MLPGRLGLSAGRGVFVRQHLFIDADDTLWENSVHFERAIEQFLAFLDHSTLSHADVRAVLDEIELANIRTHGYGSASFARNLGECYRRLCEGGITDEDVRRVTTFGDRILHANVPVIDGVEETLRDLAGRHDLILFTKGHEEEQRLKLDRSGLSRYFGYVDVVAEKDEAAYIALVSRHGYARAHCWMVGNSPKSDINPALRAGLGAVYIPHHLTWALEKQEIAPAPDGRLLLLSRFTELRDHF